MTQRSVICPECGKPMVLRQTGNFKTRDGKIRKFYGCSGFPMCKATHGAHPNGDPLGIPAIKEIKALRVEAHKLLAEKFGDWVTLSSKKKKEMYAWLRDVTPSGHVAKMGKDELTELIDLLENPVGNNAEPIKRLRME